MGRSKNGKKPLKDWSSALPALNDKMFAQIGTSLLHHDNFRTLTAGAKHLYICMVAECMGKREFTFPLSTAKGYGISKNSLSRHISELEKEGFIVKQSGKTSREPNIFCFVYAWKQNQP